MSNYRDDVNETLVLEDAPRAGQRSRPEDTVRFADATQYALRGVPKDTIVLTETWREAVGRRQDDALELGDQLSHRVSKRTRITDSIRLRDAWRWKALTRLLDTVVLHDATASSTFSRTGEGLGLSDQFTGQRRVRSFVEDTITLGDRQTRVQREQVQDSVVLAEVAKGALHARNWVLEALALSADPQADYTTGAHVVERLRITDEVVGLLRASNRVDDRILLWDEVQQSGEFGQAWTTGMDDWAMSRFAPFSFDSLAVVDGVLYGCNRHGVFALDGDSETMTAELRTGAMDMTGGVLAHPLEAHIEYELRGTATFDVTTTQAGTPATYTYPLNARPTADALTNARAVFGRGLRGRHFAYTLRLTGQQAYINDWSVLVAPSKRSI